VALLPHYRRRDLPPDNPRENMQLVASAGYMISEHNDHRRQ
jgi:hypothetical protein